MINIGVGGAPQADGQADRVIVGQSEGFPSYDTLKSAYSRFQAPPSAPEDRRMQMSTAGRSGGSGPRSSSDLTDDPPHGGTAGQAWSMNAPGGESWPF